MNNNWVWYHNVGSLLIIVVGYLLGRVIPASDIHLTWLVTLGALVLFTMVVSHGITGRFWFGWLINEQFRMSLSRLQMFLWTVVVMSAFLTVALANINAGHYNEALVIAIPQELWIAMGISTASLVGSPLILSQKKKKATNEEELKKTRVSLGLMTENENVNTVRQASGQLQRNESPEDARLYELVSGEEVGNFNVLDLTRLQNLFFTLILIGAYATNLGNLLLTKANSISESPINAFPPLDASSLALLAISHAGYLATKAVDKQPDV